MLRKMGVLAVTASLTLASAAQADLVVYDGFEIGDGGYTADEVLSNPVNASVNATAGSWAGNWATPSYRPTEQGLTFDKNGAQLVTTGGSIYNSVPTSNTVAGRAFTEQNVTNAPVVYMSYLFRAANFDPNSGTSDRMFVGMGNALANRVAALRVREDGQIQTDTGNSIAATSHMLSADETYLMVIKVDLGYGGTESPTSRKATYWINPDLDATTEGANALVTLEPDPVGLDESRGLIDSVYLFNHSAYAQPYLVDEIRVGTSYGDVIPVANEIPEPATLTLLGLGGLAALRRRRQQA